MKFAKTEWDIIKHRLGVADCIWEAFSGTDPCPITETEKELYRRCRQLFDYTPEDEVDMDDNLTAQIIWDCCYGSTFFGYMDECEDRLVRARYTKAGYSLEKKLGVSIPLD